jgi:hypothetical protein
VYCSTRCRDQARIQGEIRQCHTCGKDIYRSQADIRKSKTNLFFCNHSCRAVWTNQLRAGERHPNWKGGENAYRDILLRSGAPAVCTRCGAEDFRVLAVHHLDEDRSNNQIENLTWLCHNGHYLIHHFPDERAQFDASRPIPDELHRPTEP